MAVSRRRFLLATERPLRDADRHENEPAERGWKRAPGGSSTTRGSDDGSLPAAVSQRSRRSTLRPPRTTGRTHGPVHTRHTDRTVRPTRRRSLRSGWTHAATGDTLSIGERVCACLPRRLGCSTTRAFTFPTPSIYIVDAQPVDDEAIRSSRENLVRIQRYAVIGDNRMAAQGFPHVAAVGQIHSYELRFCGDRDNSGGIEDRGSADVRIS